MRVLLVEFVTFERIGLANYIKGLGHGVAEAYGVQSAIEILGQGKGNGSCFDAIITDMFRPEQGGSGHDLLLYINNMEVSLPCLIYSSKTRFVDGQIQIDDLNKIGNIFEFAKFEKKGLGFGYIKEFLDSVQQ